MKHVYPSPRGAPCHGNGTASRAVIAECSTATAAGTMGPDNPAWAFKTTGAKGETSAS